MSNSAETSKVAIIGTWQIANRLDDDPKRNRFARSRITTEPMLKVEDIRLIIYDFDGVMTDNRVMIDQDGRESVVVNRLDGLAISEFKKMGIEQIILSTEKNPVVQQRAKKLGLFCLQGIADKKEAVEKYLNDSGINRKRVIFVGNEINDLEAMRFVGWPMAPGDAHSDVKKIAKVVTKTGGGCGVIREVLDIVLRDRGK